eukprot:TRINITY_DN2733_c0_g1_i1.p1 TRINITY_DN2733_c0_g1~~TRINITY_DN2733_c0_g1_i1.p1  ORF type:complete len:523 (+),score=135.34 TRINITY_DN2733_c0_g1_i1:56-1624(+)
MESNSTVRIAIQETKSSHDLQGKEYLEYLVEVKWGETEWTLPKRYNLFFELYEGLQVAFPSHKFAEFPPRLLWTDAEDIPIRKTKLATFLQDAVSYKEIAESWPMQWFLEVKPHLGIKTGKKIVMPLPDTDFDPTESAVPWKILTMEGVDVYFATERGTIAKCDDMLVRPQGIIASQLAATTEAKQFYFEMETSPNFCNPIPWEKVNPSEFDGLLLPGGHAPGMKQYLESQVLQGKIAEFWELKRPVAAICHGVLLLARTKSLHTHQSVLSHRKTTTLPVYLENLGYYLSRWQYGNRYRTYEQYCENEVKSFLGDSFTQFYMGPISVGIRGTAMDHSNAFVVRDENYLSARWPGDAYYFGLEFCKMITSGNLSSPSYTTGSYTKPHQQAARPATPQSLNENRRNATDEKWGKQEEDSSIRHKEMQEAPRKVAVREQPARSPLEDPEPVIDEVEDLQQAPAQRPVQETAPQQIEDEPEQDEPEAAEEQEVAEEAEEPLGAAPIKQSRAAKKKNQRKKQQTSIN